MQTFQVHCSGGLSHNKLIAYVSEVYVRYGHPQCKQSIEVCQPSEHGMYIGYNFIQIQMQVCQYTVPVDTLVEVVINGAKELLAGLRVLIQCNRETPDTTSKKCKFHQNQTGRTTHQER